MKTLLPDKNCKKRPGFRCQAFTALRIGLLLIPLAISTQMCRKPEKAGNRINILFLMSDQHRGDYLGVSGNEWIATPNLDNLAKEGANFTKAYSSTPSCTPARTAIFTGLSPWNHGMLGYMNDASQSYICEMPSLFAQNGYITHAVGKNHFGPVNTHGYQNVELEEAWHSVRQGEFKCDYQKWFEKTAPGLDLNATGLGYTDHRGGTPFQFVDSLHPTYWTAERAIKFLERHNERDSPWFLKVSFQRPHPPFDPPKRWMDFYRNIVIPLPKVGDWAKVKYDGKTGSLYKTPSATSGIFPDEEIKESLTAYAGGLSFVDEQIGRIIATLIETGQYENTLILYTSDHGDMMGDQHMWRKCRAYEPSARIPFVLRWPDSMKTNSKRGQNQPELIELRDIFPTFADAADITIPHKVDGESIIKLIKGGKKWRRIIDLEHSQIYEKDNAWVALTDGRYKFIYFTLTGEEQLFDLEKDPYELNNLIHNSANLKLRKRWYNKMVEHLKCRGPEWVEGKRLQILEKSTLKGENFPE